MFSRFRISLALAIFLALVWLIPAFAGGWAVITLDELPSRAMVDKPLTIGFTVRQHGRTLMTGLSPKVAASLGEEKLAFPAEAGGGPGHYTATLVLPKEGDWQWSIEAFTMDQPMPALRVVAAGTAAASSPRKEFPTATLTAASIAVLALGLLIAVAGFRRKSRPIMLLTAICLLAGFALLAAGVGMSASADAKAKSDAFNDSSLSQVELGRQLFLAKGCITCHSNSKATRSSEYWTIEMGAPDLSKFSASPEVLRLRLQDPTQVKSDTMMPNLELSDAEIEALIAFINSK